MDAFKSKEGDGLIWPEQRKSDLKVEKYFRFKLILITNRLKVYWEAKRKFYRSQDSKVRNTKNRETKRTNRPKAEMD